MAMHLLLALLERTGREVGSLLQYHPGVRIGLVMADEAVLVYSPLPALIEAGPREPSQPTGLLMKQPLPTLEATLGVGRDGVLAQEVGLTKLNPESPGYHHGGVRRLITAEGLTAGSCTVVVHSAGTGTPDDLVVLLGDLRSDSMGVQICGTIDW
jgi:hypothetical protein